MSNTPPLFDIMPADWKPEGVVLAGAYRFTGGHWRVGCETNGVYVYVFTHIPHPQNPKKHTVYRFDPMVQVNAFCDFIFSKTKAPSNEPTIH